MLTDAAETLFLRAMRSPLLPLGERSEDTIFDRQVLEGLLPGDPYPFLDRVTLVDLERSIIAARYTRARPEPRRPGTPARLPLSARMQQVAAIAQAGRVLSCLRDGRPGAPGSHLADSAVVRFLRPLDDEAEAVDVVAKLVEDGPGWAVVGQCLQGDTVCVVVALAGFDPHPACHPEGGIA